MCSLSNKYILDMTLDTPNVSYKLTTYYYDRDKPGVRVKVYNVFFDLALLLAINFSVRF